MKHGLCAEPLRLEPSKEQSALRADGHVVDVGVRLDVGEHLLRRGAPARCGGTVRWRSGGAVWRWDSGMVG